MHADGVPSNPEEYNAPLPEWFFLGAPILQAQIHMRPLKTSCGCEAHKFGSNEDVPAGWYCPSPVLP